MSSKLTARAHNWEIEVILKMQHMHPGVSLTIEESRALRGELEKAVEAARDIVAELLDPIGPAITEHGNFLAERLDAHAFAEAEATLLWADAQQDAGKCWCRGCWEEWWGARPQ